MKIGEEGGFNNFRLFINFVDINELLIGKFKEIVL